jgi:transcriptional regulator
MSGPAVTVADAVRLDREYEQLQRMADAVLLQRNRVVLCLVEHGEVQAELAEALGKSPARVSQIAAAGRRRRLQDAEDARNARRNEALIQAVEAA